jgi:hypothetical protein
MKILTGQEGMIVEWTIKEGHLDCPIDRTGACFRPSRQESQETVATTVSEPKKQRFSLIHKCHEKSSE